MLVPMLVLAQASGLVPDPPQVLQGSRLGNPNTNVTDLVQYIINILLLVVGIFSVFFIIWGSYQYIISGANEEQAEAGKKTIRNAIIGLIITILSYVIVTVVANALIGRV